MKIAAWSDGHGTLPEIKEYVDVVIIAGDIVPLYIQRNTLDSLTWFTETFFEYVKDLNCKKVIMTPGNHDFLFENISPQSIKSLINGSLIKDKLVYLLDESFEYKGHVFYGTPWVTGLYNWAFYTADPEITYNHIPDDTTILVSHMPPKVDKVGCSYPYLVSERNFGSDNLAKVIDNHDVMQYVFCGHIHTGVHDGVPFGKKMIYNVSLKNEDYKDVYDITYLTI